MVKCSNCGKYNHETETRCTKCGKSLKNVSNGTRPKYYKNKHFSKNKGILFGITAFGVLGILLLIITLTTLFSPTTSSDSYIDNSTHPEAQNVVILSSSGHRDGIGDYVLEGEVQNQNSFGVAYVKVIATGYDDKGNIVSTDYAYAYSSNEAEDTDVSPQGTAKFTLYLEDPDNKIVRYDVRVSDADQSLYHFSTDSSSTSSSSSSSSNDFKGGFSGTGVSCTACDSLNTVLLSEETRFDSMGRVEYWDTFQCKDCGNVFTEPFPDSGYSSYYHDQF